MATIEIRLKNLEALIEEFGGQRQLAERADLTPSVISQLKTGRRSLGEKLARKIEAGAEKPTGWMDVDHTGEPSNVSPGPDIRGLVPLISWVQAGCWEEIVDNFHTGDAEEWRPTTANCGPHAFALRVTGDSMVNPYGFPSIPEGSVVIVDPDRPADNGKIVVAKLVDSQEATLKRLVIDGPNKYLKPLNPDYKPIEINGNCRIVGVVRQIIADL